MPLPVLQYKTLPSRSLSQLFPRADSVKRYHETPGRRKREAGRIPAFA